MIISIFAEEEGIEAQFESYIMTFFYCVAQKKYRKLMVVGGTREKEIEEKKLGNQKV